MNNRPKFLYLYPSHFGPNKKIIKHIVDCNCNLERINPQFTNSYWRCKGLNHDIYGFSDKQDLIKSEVFNTKERIQDEIIWLRKISKEKGWRLELE